MIVIAADNQKTSTFSDGTTLPDVSIIVPVYNVREYLEQCIDSLLDQTLTSIEILLIDDGSTDESGEIIDRYAEAHSDRVRAFHKRNGGLSDARNFGLDHARGQYVGFVDSDDWVEPEMFERMFEKANSTDSDIVVCGGVKHLAGTGTSVDLQVRGDLSLFGQSVKEAPRLLFACHSLAWNKLYRRRLFDGGTNRFPVGQWFEDSAIVYTILDQANKIECVPEKFYNYRVGRDGSITTAVDDRIFDAFISCNAILSQFDLSHEDADPELRLTVERLVRNHLIARFSVLFASSDRPISMRYVKRTFEYLDENFPGWKSRYRSGSKRPGLSFAAKRNLLLAYIAILMPRWLKAAGHTAIRSALVEARSVRGLWKHWKSERKKRHDRALLRQYGFVLIETVVRGLDEIGVSSFADFGTLLGLVREGGFMNHDLDVDLGIVGHIPVDPNAIRRKLESVGCKLWRRYSLQGRIVEESYYFRCDEAGSQLKFDVNYYVTDDHGARTWLFYLDPAQKYLPRQRSVVEMRYSAIGPLELKDFGGHPIPVPSNAEALLEEKYGPSWRKPDSSWIYWKSPAATPLAVREYYTNPGALPRIPPERLRDLQLQQLRVLEYLEGMLQRHGLKYYLNEGTLLGAVRHQGYIPWDDDIDIAIPRGDYERLLTLPATAWPKEIRLWSHTTDPSYHLPFAKIVATWPSDYRNTMPPDIATVFSGPRIDVFPLDRVPLLRDNGKKEWRKVRYWRSLLALKRGVSHPKTLQQKIKRLVALSVTYSFLHRRIYSLSVRHNDRRSATRIINWGSSYAPSRQCVPSDWYGIPSSRTFEGRERPCPAEPERILRSIYGDYMTPPPPDKRTSGSHYMMYLPAEDGRIPT